MRRQMHTGFTLLELLVVIGVVLVLTALLFPVLAKVRKAGHRVSCLNNLRQLQMAFLLYTDDHDGQFPCTDDNFLWMGRYWRPVLRFYVDTKKSFWCPSDAMATTKYDSTSYAYLQAFYHRPEDMILANKGGYRTCIAKPEAQTLANVTYPAQKILIYEWTSNHDKTVWTMWEPTGFHMAAFVDGHAALVRQELLNLNALGDRDPNWTLGGVGGKDITD